MSALANQVPFEQFTALLKQYDIGDVLSLTPVAHGIENQNYFVEAQSLTRTHKYVLTLLMAQSNAGDDYVSMMNYLDNQGLPVAPPLPNRQGDAITLQDQQPCMLQRRLSGQHTVNPTRKQIEALARFTARMHLASLNADFQLPVYPRDAAWLIGQATAVNNELSFNDRSLLTDSLTQVTSLLARRDVQQLPRGLIHGDLFRDNVLFNERGLSGVLDFHHAATGYLVYDLAVAANDWCSDAGGLLDPDRTTYLLRAYHKIRPLTEAEVWFFSIFTSYAALSFWLSRAAKFYGDGTEGNERTKDPQEFQRILHHTRSRRFYLDYRALSG